MRWRAERTIHLWVDIGCANSFRFHIKYFCSIEMRKFVKALMCLILQSGSCFCSSEDNAAYLRIAQHEWKDKPQSTPDLPFKRPHFFCRRFINFWRSDSMRHTREQYGDLCTKPSQPLPLFFPTILGVCSCACWPGWKKTFRKFFRLWAIFRGMAKAFYNASHVEREHKHLCALSHSKSTV